MVCRDQVGRCQDCPHMAETVTDGLIAGDATAEEQGPRGRAAVRSRGLSSAMVALAVGAALAAFTGLARTPLCEPAEGLSADIARTMIESGDWVVPHHNGSI